MMLSPPSTNARTRFFVLSHAIFGVGLIEERRNVMKSTGGFGRIENWVLRMCLLDEKTVLLQIRSEITYSSASTKLLLWDERVDSCRWPGLSCNDANGYVTTLNLSHGGSVGFNVSLLLKLPSLSVIMLDGIYFPAPFPDFFQGLKNLTVLSLAGWEQTFWSYK
nr:receptor-like protein 12 [Ipomoea batatas]